MFFSDHHLNPPLEDTASSLNYIITIFQRKIKSLHPLNIGYTGYTNVIQTFRKLEYHIHFSPYIIYSFLDVVFPYFCCGNSWEIWGHFYPTIVSLHINNYRLNLFTINGFIWHLVYKILRQVHNAMTAQYLGSVVNWTDTIWVRLSQWRIAIRPVPNRERLIPILEGVGPV